MFAIAFVSLVGENLTVETRCRTDSAACKGISQRLGCGRVRHLQCGLLWIQQAVKENAVTISCIPGATITATSEQNRWADRG